MGLPERLVDRQLERAQGRSRQERLRSLRTGQNMLLAAVVLGLLTAVLNVAVLNVASRLFAEWLWGVLGVVWLGVGYVTVRQRRYVRQLLAAAEH